MTAYYNEIDPVAAEWLRRLVAKGLIAPGDVDERDIRDVRPDDLRGYRQVHMFAGIAGWSCALRRAGWPDDRPVWTASCPCQPFSAAGRGAGVADERHLWPFFFHLVCQCRPVTIFGEQVASPDGLTWLDLVQADLEGESYATGALDICAAGVGAPHIRQRLYWVADSMLAGRAERRAGAGDRPIAWSGGVERVADVYRAGFGARSEGREALGHGETVGTDSGTGGMADAESQRERANEPRPNSEVGEFLAGAKPGGDCFHNGATGGMADADCRQFRRQPDGEGRLAYGPAAGWEQSNGSAAGDCATGGMADADGGDARAEWQQRGGEQRLQPQDGRTGRLGDTSDTRLAQRLGVGGVPGGAACPEPGQAALRTSVCATPARPAGPANGRWALADWLFCRDGKWRPVEPGTFPLAAGVSGRVGALRAYGNGLCIEEAQSYIEAYLTR